MWATRFLAKSHLSNNYRLWNLIPSHKMQAERTITLCPLGILHDTLIYAASFSACGPVKDRSRRQGGPSISGMGPNLDRPFCLLCQYKTNNAQCCKISSHLSIPLWFLSGSTQNFQTPINIVTCTTLKNTISCGAPPGCYIELAVDYRLPQC